MIVPNKGCRLRDELQYTNFILNDFFLVGMLYFVFAFAQYQLKTTVFFLQIKEFKCLGMIHTGYIQPHFGGGKYTGWIVLTP